MSTELAIRPDQTSFDDKQVAALRSLGVEDAPPGDVALLFHQSVRTGLDPFAKQIYLIGRDERRQVNGRWQTVGKKWTIQTGIDGYRVIRDRKGNYDGQEEFWCGPDGVWKDVWASNEPPFAARVLVYIKDRSRPVPGIAYFAEYAQRDRDGNPQAMWKTRPAGQLLKCAEALALRKAYPQDLAGTYIDEEMQQAENGADGVPVVTKVQPPRQQPKRDDRHEPPSGTINPDTYVDMAMHAHTLDALRQVWKDAARAGALDQDTRAGMTVREALTARGEALTAQAAHDAAEAPPEEPEGAPFDYDESELV